MWEFEYTEKIKSKLPKYKKKHPNEIKAVADNIDTYQNALRCGAKPLVIHFGFLHREMNGVVAIDQSGHGSSMQETRLYAYPDEISKTIYLITVGEKNGQDRDLKDCREFIKSIKK